MAEEFRLIVVSNFGKRQTRKGGTGTVFWDVTQRTGDRCETPQGDNCNDNHQGYSLFENTDKTSLKSYRILREVYSNAFRGSPVD